VDQLEKIAIRKLLRGLLGSRARGAASAAKVFAGSAAGKITKERAPKGFAKAISEKDVNRAWDGYKQNGSGGTDSLVATIPAWIAEKALGKDKVKDFFWKNVHKPALRADTAVGHTLGKIPGAKGLFTTTEKIPWGKRDFREIDRSSALAPLSKIRDIGAPIIVGVGLEKGVKKLTGSKDKEQQEKAAMQDQGMREKVASTMLRLHEENIGHTKRAQATRLLFKKAELGLEHIPHTYQELEEKIASLENQDLVVLEKALELAGGHFKLGELDSGRLSAINATEKFQAAVLGDEN